MPLIEHLRELRSRFLKVALAVVVGSVICWIFYDFLFDLLRHPYCISMESHGQSCKLNSFDPLEQFTFKLQVAGYGGVLLASPILFYQLWRFIAPGLYRNERRYAVGFVGASLALFLFGTVIAYLTLPMALDFLLFIGGDGIQNLTNVTKYVGLALFTMAAFGLGFEFPVVLVALQLLGVVAPTTLARRRREMIVAIAAVAAVITPSSDPFSMFALAIPMYVLYEVSIVLGRAILKRRGDRPAARPPTA